MKGILRVESPKGNQRILEASTRHLKAMERAFSEFELSKHREELKEVISMLYLPHLDSVSGVEFYTPTPGKKYLFTCGSDGLLHLYDYNTPVLFNPTNLQ